MECMLKSLWGCATIFGTRRITGTVRRLSAYGDTQFFFEGGVDGFVALSIDDGLSRGGMETSLAADVLALLSTYDARCTFFVCSKYLSNVPAQAAALLAAGNELANHLEEDVFGYSKMPAAQFEAALQSATDAIEAIPGAAVRWFRAPQGVFTKEMKRVTEAKGLRHAIGDAYCDDWAVTDAKWVARTLLRQARSGSIIIMHMPEKGFREHTLLALELVLQGLAEQKLKCRTLTEMQSKASGTAAAAAVAADSAATPDAAPPELTVELL